MGKPIAPAPLDDVPQAPVEVTMKRSIRRDFSENLESSSHLDEIIDPRIPTFTSSHGKSYYFPVHALGCLSLHNPLRVVAMKLITNVWFDRSVLIMIVCNSIIMALTDYSVVNDDYEPVSKGSWRNSLGANTEIFFVAAFTFEMTSKILAMGFWTETYPHEFSPGHPDTYLRDYWNILDFIVVITGFATFIPSLPNVSVIRTFRVLRPLKSVAGLEGVKMVLVAVTNSIPELVSVIVLLIFVFAIFGILGLQFFLGLSHSRCRLTPYPVTTDWEVGMDYKLYECLDGGKDYNFNKVFHKPWTKSSSMWAEKQPCYWPLDPSDSRLCSLSGPDIGMHQCWHGDFFEKHILPFNPDKAEAWCGSNFDATGNLRFEGSKGSLDIYGLNHTAGRSYTATELAWSANYVGEFMWGFLDFDNFLRAFLTIFQTITLEGWTDVMYMLMDAYNPVMTSSFFIILVCFGSFFVLNLLLAVLENNYNEQEQANTDRKDQEKAQREKELLTIQIDAMSVLSDDAIGANIDENAGWTSDFPMGDFDFDSMLEEETTAMGLFDHYLGWCIMDPHSEEAKERNKFRQLLYDFVQHPRFGIAITLCICLNTIVLAADHHPMDPGFESMLEILNFAFTLIFVVEMFLKVPGLGVRLYLSDTFNCFDFVIVVISIVESITIPPSFIKKSESTAGGGISALRSFRLFRIFKLAREWEAMRQLLDLIVKTAIQMGNFLLLFVIFIYIYALLGMQFFAGRMHFDEDGYPVDINAGGDRTLWEDAEIPRSNFDTIVWATTTIFQILTGENWNTVMYDGMRAAGYGAVFYFITLVVFGNFIVMNIFMAILLANFDELAVGSHDDDKPKDGKVAPDPMTTGGHGKIKAAMERNKKESLNNGKESLNNGKESLNNNNDENENEHSSFPNKFKINGSGSGSNIGRDGPATKMVAAIKGVLPLPDLGGDNDSPRANIWTSTKEMSEYEITAKINDGELAIDHPLSMNKDMSWPRLICRKIVTRKWFDHSILICIILSSVTLAIDSPLNDPDTTLSASLYILDWTMTIIFTIEMILKIAGLGLWGHDEAYLTNGWNLLDGVIVIVGWIGLLADDNLSAFKALRALRALKPLRMINRYPGLQVVVGTMISSIGAIANVAIVTLLVFVIFSIMAVNYLKGKFFSCQGDFYDEIDGTDYGDFLTKPLKWNRMTDLQKSWFQPNSPVPNVDFSNSSLGCHGYEEDENCCRFNFIEKPTSRQICSCWGMDWDRNIYQSFDNTWVALGALFQISTTEGWVDVMLAAVDAPEMIDMQPIVNNNEAWIAFFVFFMIIGSFLMTNLFVGVIIQNFNDLKEKKEKEQEESGMDEADLLMTEDQRMWSMTQKLLAQMIEMQFHRPSPPKGKFKIRKYCFLLVTNKLFDHVIISCIILNTFVMAMSFFGMEDMYSFVLDVCNFIFAMIFNVECVLKLIALDYHYFYSKIGTRVVWNNWNIFDFLVVTGTNIGLIASPPFQEKGSGGGGGVATVIRMFRIGRLLRLINGAQSIKKMFDTLIMTLPGLANVAAVVFLLFFIFAVIGVQLFATTAYNESLNEHANFRTFGMAIVTLFRFATGENWNGFMYEASHGGYSGWHDIESTLESDGSNPRIRSSNTDDENGDGEVKSGSGYCDANVNFMDKFVGGPYDGLKYGDVMCGFKSSVSVYATQADGCVELNGCANFFIFPYLKSFTLLITFVFLNLFVGIILDGFSQAEERGGAATISETEFMKIWHHWVEYDPEETYCIDFYKVKAFLQTLHTPWGFGLDYVASDAELIIRVKDLNLTVGPNGKIHFFKVLKGLSRRYLKLTNKEIDFEKIDEMESPEQTLTLTKNYGHIPNFSESVDMTENLQTEQELEELSHILARIVIGKALKRHVETRRFKGEKKNTKQKKHRNDHHIYLLSHTSAHNLMYLFTFLPIIHSSLCIYLLSISVSISIAALHEAVEERRSILETSPKTKQGAKTHPNSESSPTSNSRSSNDSDGSQKIELTSFHENNNNLSSSLTSTTNVPNTSAIEMIDKGNKLTGGGGSRPKSPNIRTADL